MPSKFDWTPRARYRLWHAPMLRPEAAWRGQAPRVCGYSWHRACRSGRHEARAASAAAAAGVCYGASSSRTRRGDAVGDAIRLDGYCGQHERDILDAAGVSSRISDGLPGGRGICARASVRSYYLTYAVVPPFTRTKHSRARGRGRGGAGQM
ncbi:hypothetical protein BC628DRAFT_523279 [Trametes gibbosa]|nr:hypothetical protein BC628DRAFT_523279 [Trametes gibbosa]